MTAYRGFMLFPDGRIEEVDEDGATWDYDPAPGLFDDLVHAGYPLHSDTLIERWDGTIDLRVEDGRVIVHTTGAKPREHDMGPVGELFLAWFRSHAEEAPDDRS